jgi:hypothetical protein
MATVPRLWWRDDGMLVRRTPRSVLVMRADGEQVLRLQFGALAVWELLDRPRARNGIIDALGGASSAGTDSTARSVDATLRLLLEAGVVRCS